MIHDFRSIYPQVVVYFFFQNAVLWLDSRNFTELIRGVYARRCRYPLNFTYPQNFRQALEESIMIKNNFIEEERNALSEKVSQVFP